MSAESLGVELRARPRQLRHCVAQVAEGALDAARAQISPAAVSATPALLREQAMRRSSAPLRRRPALRRAARDAPTALRR